MTYGQAKVLGIIVFASTAVCRADPAGVFVPLDGKTPVKITHTATETATGVGIGAKGTGDQSAIKGQNFTAPSATLTPSPTANGGGGDVDVSAQITGHAAFRWGLGIFGVVLIAAGIFGAVKLGWSGKTLMGCVGIGAICVATAIWPAFLAILLALGLIGAVVFWLVEAHGTSSVTKAFKSYVNHIDGGKTHVPGLKENLAQAAALKAVPDVTTLAAKIIKAETVT